MGGSISGGGEDSCLSLIWQRLKYAKTVGSLVSCATRRVHSIVLWSGRCASPPIAACSEVKLAFKRQPPQPGPPRSPASIVNIDVFNLHHHHALCFIVHGLSNILRRPARKSKLWTPVGYRSDRRFLPGAFSLCTHSFSTTQARSLPSFMSFLSLII